MRSSRWAKGLFRLLGWTAIFLVVGYVALHAVTRFAVRTIAGKLGLSDVSFDVRSVSLRRVVLGDIRLGAGGAPRVGTVEVDFSLVELASGKIRAVHVEGVEVTVDATGVQPTVVGVQLPTSAGAAAAPGKPLTIMPGDLPAVVDVASSIVHVKLPSGEIRIPVSAKFGASAAGGKAEGELSLGTDSLTFSAEGSSAGAWTAKAAGKISVGAFLPLLPEGTLPPGAIVDARVGVDASYDVATRTGKVEASVTNATARGDFSGNAISISGLAIDAKADLLGSDVKGSVSLAGNLRVPWLDGRTKVQVEGKYDGGEVTGTVAAVGPSISLSVPAASYGKGGAAADVKVAVTPSTWMLAHVEKSGVAFKMDGPVTASAHVERAADGAIVARVTNLGAGVTDVLAGGGVEVPRANLSMSGANVAGAAGKDWNFTLEGVEATAGGPKAFAADAKVTTAEVAGRISASGEVEFDAPDIVANVEPTDVTVGPAAIAGAGATLHMRAGGTADDFTVTLKEGSSVSVRGIKDAANQLEVGSLTLALAQRSRPTTGPGASTAPATQPDPPLLSVRKGQPVRIAFNSQTTAPVGIDSANVKASVGHVLGNLELTLGQQIGVDGYIKLEKSDIDLPAIDAKVRGVTLKLPLALDALKPRDGEITMESIERDGKVLPAMVGHLWVTRKGAYAGFDWPLVSEGIVKGEVQADFLTGGATSIAAHMWIPEFSFSKSDDVRKLLPPGLADLDVTGRFSAELRYSIVNGHTTRWGEIEVKDASMRSRKLGDTNLTGVNGHVWTRNFSPLETAPNQTLSVKSARLGDLVVNDGNVRFRIDPGDIIFIEDATFGYAGGTLSARGFRLAPLQSATDLVLYADHLDLAEFAKVASAGKVTARGSLFARLPVSLNWDKRTLSIGTGYLYADARPGALSLGVTESDVARLVGVKAENSNDIVKKFTTSLTNFKYSALSLDLYRDPNNHLDGVARLAGKGAEGTPAQALDLTLNLHGLDNGLEDLLQLFLFK